MRSSKITPIRGGEISKTLDRLMEQMRDGNLVALSFAVVRSDGECREGWAGDLDSCTLDMFAAINILRDGFFHQRIEHYSSADVGAS